MLRPAHPALGTHRPRSAAASHATRSRQFRPAPYWIERVSARGLHLCCFRIAARAARLHGGHVDDARPECATSSDEMVSRPVEYSIAALAAAWEAGRVRRWRE